MRPGLEQLRDKQFGVFTTRQVLCEYTRAELRARIDRGQWVRVFQGVYRKAVTPPSPELRVEAARLSMGLAALAAAYATAAELHGFAVLADQPTHVLGVRASRCNRLVVHRDRVDPAELELIRGTVVTKAIRTAADLARTLPRMDALATLDAALGSGISRGAIADEIGKHTGRRGRRQAAELIELADGRAESPMESRARLRCIDAGLPRPSRNSRCRPGTDSAASISAGGIGGSAWNTTAPHGIPGRLPRCVTIRATTGSPPKDGPSTTPPPPTSTTTRTTSLRPSGARSIERSGMVAAKFPRAAIPLRSAIRT